MQRFKLKIIPLFIIVILLSSNSCKDEVSTDNPDHDTEVGTVIDVDLDLFLEGTTVTTMASTPTDHEMGPWCPDNISDDEEAGLCCKF